MNESAIKTRVCKQCGIEKYLNKDNFPFRTDTNSFRWLCQVCYLGQKKDYYKDNVERISIRASEYYQNNRDEIIANVKEYSAKHKEEHIAYDKQYYEAHKKEKIEYQIEYRSKDENKAKISARKRKYQQKRRKTDLGFRLKSTISKSINNALKRRHSSKSRKSCTKYLPFTFKELIKYIENLFEPWMNWDNHGIYNPKTWDDNNQSTWTWQLDHIKPHSDFNYTSMNSEEFKECWSLSNLRPLNAKQNILDGINRTRHLNKRGIK